MNVDTSTQVNEANGWQTDYVSHLCVFKARCSECGAKIPPKPEVFHFRFDLKEWKMRRRNRYYNRKFGTVRYPETFTSSS